MNYTIIDKLKKVVAWTPKCGCTSVKNQILFDLGVEINNDNIHHYFIRNFKINSPILKKHTEYKFEMYVRDPYYRILSCFLNKVVTNNKLSPNISFRDFVFNIDFYAKESLEVKQHTRPQSLNYFEANWNVYDISKHSFSHGIIYNKTNHSRGFVQNAWNIPKKNLIKNNSTYSKDSFCDFSILEKVKLYYGNDYDLLSRYKIDFI